MTTLFWALEYVKVLIAYGVIFFLWPSIVLRKFLKEKTFTFQFSFCLCFMILLLNTEVLLLGLIHCLKGWIISLLFYGPVVYQLIKYIYDNREAEEKQLKKIVSGTYGIKQLLFNMFRSIGRWFNRGWIRFRVMFQNHIFEAILLVLVMIFGVIYFSYGAFQDYSFGCGDMYVHNAWINGLENGKIFSAGVYPEGMHCLIYGMHVLFGIRTYSLMLFFQGIHSFTFLAGAYILLKEIFRWRYTPTLVLFTFLVLDIKATTMVISMSRLQWTIPQEFALFTTFLCAAFLIRYLRSDKNKKFIEDENLIMFTLTIAASIAVHVYPTIMAVFLCIAFVPVFVTKIFRPKTFLTLLVSAIIGALVAIIPMAAALATGIKFQGSIGWAMNVINGENSDDEELNSYDGDDAPEEITHSQATGSMTFEVPDTSTGETTTYSVAVATPAETPEQDLSLSGRLEGLYKGGYQYVYGRKRGKLIVNMLYVAFGCFVALRIIRTARKLIRKDKFMKADIYDNYLSLILAAVIFMVNYAAEHMGIPSLVAAPRLYTVCQVLTLGACAIPLDALFGGLLNRFNNRINMLAGATMVVGIYCGTKALGIYRGYLCYELTRHNGAVLTTISIVDDMPKNSYTIVSPVDELYQVAGYGYHEEAVLFVNNSVDTYYTLPSEYVFIYVEKNALQYAQNQYFSGPSWLADEKYPSYYGDDVVVSQYPDIVSVPITPELAEPPFYAYPISSKAYSEISTRVVLESRLQRWCEDFDKLYPNELNVYYEDDDFVCYYFRQNPYSLYQLGFQTEEESAE